MVKSLDEVIERLQYKADNIKAKLEPSYFIECIDYLKTLPKEGQWISVNDGQLPGNGEQVLLSFENHSMVLTGMFIEDEEGGAFHLLNDNKTCSHYGMFVNAWQPIPKQYKEGE